MSFSKRMILSAIIFFALFFFVMPNIYAYWINIPDPEPNTDQGGYVAVGVWYYTDPGVAPPIIFDPADPPTTTIPAGSIVVYQNPDGTTTAYTALVDIPPGSGDFDPSVPNSQWWERMTYAEDTAEYRYFHHYYQNDYVWYNGQLYRWRRNVPHNPNTVTEVTPGNSNYWAKVDFSTLPENLWYRHVIYTANAQVYYNGNYDICAIPGKSGFEHDLYPANWTLSQ